MGSAKTDKRLKRGLQIFGILAILLSLFPLIAADYWWIRVFDFPHLQLTALTLLAILVYFWKFEIRLLNDYLFVGILLACLAFQVYKIFPYTPLASIQVPQAEEGDDPAFTLFAANVLQSNTADSLLKKALREVDPDLVVLTETNGRWERALRSFTESRYPYRTLAPLENTYGMLVYSKIPLVNARVRYIVDDSIPSTHAGLTLPTGDTLQLYAIHPTPPMPQHNPLSTDRDAELMRIAKLSRHHKRPVMVVGDFNDVSWSGTTQLFQRVGRFLDVRQGRGFYNTFNAKNRLLRWPLDHLFVQPGYRVVSWQRGGDIGSDHFPIIAKIAFRLEDRGKLEVPDASAADLEKASGIIGEEIRQDREQDP